MGFQLLQPPAIEPVLLDEAKIFARITTDNEDDLIESLITSSRESVETFLNRKIITQRWRMYLDAFPGYIDQRLGGNIVQAPIAIGATSYMAGIRWAIMPEYSPVQSIDALSYIGPDPLGTTVTMNPETDYLVDIISNPARVCPPFGKFWPISRIQTNSVWIDWTAGFGNPITVSVTQGSAVTADYDFQQSDVGKMLTVPNAGSQSPVADLVTTILSVDTNGNATLAVQPGATIEDAPGWLGLPVPESIKTAIKLLVTEAYENREPTAKDAPNMPIRVKRLLYQFRDLRL